MADQPQLQARPDAAFQHLHWTNSTGPAHAAASKPLMNAAGTTRSRMSCLASRNSRSDGLMCREDVERSSTADPGRGREGPHALVFDRFTRERMALDDILPDGVYEPCALASRPARHD